MDSVKKVEQSEKMVNITFIKNKDKITEHVKSCVPIQSPLVNKRSAKVM